MRLSIKILAVLFAFGVAASGLGLAAQALSIYSEENMPYSGITADGKLTGVGVEIVQEIQKRVRNKDPIQVVPWARGLAEVQNSSNGVLFCTVRTEQRDPIFQWVGPLVESGYAFYSLSNSPLSIKTVDDAKKVKAIGVVQDDARDLFLTAAGFTNLERTSDYAANFKKLLLGRIDLVAGTQATAESLFMEAGGKAGDLKQLLVFFRSQVWIAFSKGMDPAIVKAWGAAFAAMKKDGTYAAIYKKYLPNLPLPGPAITF
jgi:polar amino acid transport system substrate-binding protein